MTEPTVKALCAPPFPKPVGVFVRDIARLQPSDGISHVFDAIGRETPQAFLERARAETLGTWKTIGTFSSAVNALHKVLAAKAAGEAQTRIVEGIDMLKRAYMRDARMSKGGPRASKLLKAEAPLQQQYEDGCWDSMDGVGDDKEGKASKIPDREDPNEVRRLRARVAVLEQEIDQLLLMLQRTRTSCSS